MDDEARTILEEDRRVAEELVRGGAISRAKAQECLAVLEAMLSRARRPYPRLTQVLVRMGYLTPPGAAAEPAPAAGPDAPAVDISDVAHDESSRTLRPLPPEVVAAAQDPSNLLGRYVLLQRLGRGGTGEVYRGFDVQLRRPVAVKFLLTANREELARFIRECQVAAQFSHPNLVTVHEVGRLPADAQAAAHGRDFLVMEYLEGLTLEAYPRGDMRRLVEIVAQAARGLQYAHDRGVVHRDVKPSNVLVTREGRVVVTDFGLAQEMKGVWGTPQTGTARSDQIMAPAGTPAYMSPEQARGRGVSDPRADVYSLGATLYSVLAGRPPFEGETSMDTLIRVSAGEPAPLRQVNPSVPKGLDAIVSRAMSRDPALRHPRIAEFAEDLELFLAQGWTLTKGTTRRVRPGRGAWLRTAILVALGVLAGAVIGIVVWNWFAERKMRERVPVGTVAPR